MAYRELDVTDWPVLSQETDGAEPKDWITPPTRATSDSRTDWWLFKPTKSGIRKASGGGHRPYRRHDDVTERIACALAALIGLPVADVELARRHDGHGSMSRNVTPDGWSIQGGDIALSELPGYLSCQLDPRPKNRIGHSLPNIRAVLQSTTGPPGPLHRWSAYAVFVGYLVFDAWISNTDRHAMNWAVLERGPERALAPSFDHGSALASGVADDDIPRLDPIAFSSGGRASRFENGRTLGLVELALGAIEDEPAAHIWLDRLQAVTAADVSDVIGGIPAMSVLRRTFVEQLLIENRRRLLS